MHASHATSMHALFPCAACTRLPSNPRGRLLPDPDLSVTHRSLLKDEAFKCLIRPDDGEEYDLNKCVAALRFRAIKQWQ